jgi:hypothetical protein
VPLQPQECAAFAVERFGIIRLKRQRFIAANERLAKLPQFPEYSALIVEGFRIVRFKR